MYHAAWCRPALVLYGDALYRTEDHEKAAAVLSRALSFEMTEGVRAHVFNTIGVCQAAMVIFLFELSFGCVSVIVC